MAAPLLLATLFLAPLSPAMAQEQPPAAAPAASATPVPGARFSFSQTPDGLLRLDTQTGAVSLCGKDMGASGYACTLLPDSRTAYENEITRLRAEISALQARIAQAGTSGAAERNGAPNAEEPGELDPGNLSGDTPPNPSDVEAALAYAERALLWLKQFYDRINGPEPATPPAGPSARPGAETL